jgi:chromosome segregation ATPase
VLQVDPLFALLTVQGLLVFAGLTIFMIIRYRKLSAREAAAQREMQALHSEVDKQARMNIELTSWKDMFDDLQKNFEGIRTANVKLKDSMAALIPEAERSKEYEQLIADIEKNNITLDNCIGSMKKENKELENTITSLEREAEGLSDLLQQTVRKEELDRALEQKQSLKLKNDKMKSELGQLRTDYENLQKSHETLQKEYNALYDNIEAAKMS